MRKTDKIYIGDKVKTKKTFRPLDKNKQRFDPKGAEYEGIVLDKRGSFLIVDFGEETPFTHYLSGMLTTPTGSAVEFKHLAVTETYKSDDEDEQAFVCMMREARVGKINELPREIRAKEEGLASLVGDIKSRNRDIASLEATLEKSEFELREMKDSTAVIDVDSGRIAKQYQSVLKSSKIKSIKIYDSKRNPGGRDIIVTTNDLSYRTENHIGGYVLGAYKFLIPLDIGMNISAVNYTKHVRRFELSHPCVHNGSICMGSAVEEEVYKLRRAGDIVNLIYILINFLEEPQYGEPHIDDVRFYPRQDVTMKIDDEHDWFSRDVWGVKEAWDGEKYDKEVRDISRMVEEGMQCYKCDSDPGSGVPTSEAPCPNCGSESN